VDRVSADTAMFLTCSHWPIETGTNPQNFWLVHKKNEPDFKWGCPEYIIQDDSEANIFGGDSVGHCDKKKGSYEHVYNFIFC
jgi:hypothetical protein